jgi:hypothetical protein
MVFVIEDERHAEQVGRFSTRTAAEAELRRLAALPWDKPPNLCPCTSWRTCGRLYYVVEYDEASRPWRKLGEEARLEVSATGVTWLSAGTPD